MFRVTSLTQMPEQQLNRWIKRVALLFFAVLVAFIAFYAVDRFRAPAAPIVDREVAQLEETIRANPADAAARGQLGERYFVKGRFDEAVTQFTALIDANMEVMPASFGRARALQELGQLDKAITDYEKVVEIGLTGEMAGIDPVLAAAYFGLGQIAMTQGRAQDAVDHLTKSIEISRTDADTLLALGNALLAVDLPEQAIDRLDLAIRLVPVGWSEPYIALETAYTATGKPALAEWAGAMAAFNAGDIPTARTELTALIEGDQAVRATASLGLIAEAEGDTAGAADWFRKALAIDEDDATATLGLARVTVPVASPAASPAEGSNN
jgi:tetratricopeptide (TPR) repeat protein